MIDLEQLPLADEAHDRMFMDLWIQDFGACTLSAADEVSLFVALADGARTPAELADLLRLEQRPLWAVCRALVAMQALTTDGQSFALTPFARSFWVKRTPLYRGREFDRHRFWEQHERIVATLESGWAPIDDDDKSFTEAWRDGNLSEESAGNFTRVMHSMILTPSLAAVRSGAFTSVRHLVDVGGGSGALAATFLAHHPNALASVMDLAAVCAASRQILSGVKSGGDVTYLPCNFFEDPWPTDADGFCFSNILHDWPVDTCRGLLRRAFEALAPGGRVFVHEALLAPDRCSPRMTALFSLLMLMNHRGQQFTCDELFELLRDAGFEAPRVVHSYSYWSLVEASKPGG